MVSINPIFEGIVRIKPEDGVMVTSHCRVEERAQPTKCRVQNPARPFVGPPSGGKLAPRQTFANI